MKAVQAIYADDFKYETTEFEERANDISHKCTITCRPSVILFSPSPPPFFTLVILFIPSLAPPPFLYWFQFRYLWLWPVRKGKDDPLLQVPLSPPPLSPSFFLPLHLLPSSFILFNWIGTLSIPSNISRYCASHLFCWLVQVHCWYLFLFFIYCLFSFFFFYAKKHSNI